MENQRITIKKGCIGRFEIPEHDGMIGLRYCGTNQGKDFTVSVLQDITSSFMGFVLESAAISYPIPHHTQLDDAIMRIEVPNSSLRARPYVLFLKLRDIPGDEIEITLIDVKRIYY